MPFFGLFGFYRFDGSCVTFCMALYCVGILLDFFSGFIFPVLFQWISKIPLFNFPRFYIALFGIIRNRQCGGKEQSALQMERALLNISKL